MRKPRQNLRTVFAQIAAIFLKCARSRRADGLLKGCSPIGESRLAGRDSDDTVVMVVVVVVMIEGERGEPTSVVFFSRFSAAGLNHKSARYRVMLH